MFFNVLSSKFCKNETYLSLAYDYTMGDFVKLKEYVEIMDAYELAIHKDEEAKNKTNPKR